MTPETIYLTVGKKRPKAVPVKVTRPRKGVLRLASGLNKDLITEIKNLKGAKYEPEGKTWTVSDCERNTVQLALLQGQMPPQLARFELPLEPFRFRREDGPCPCRGRFDDCPGCKGTNVFHAMKHQNLMASQGWTCRRGIWAAEQGTGKTAPAFEIMERAAEELGFTEWVWVAPKGGIEATKREAEKWGLKVMPTFVGYHLLRKFLESWPKKRKAPHGVIFDEFSRCKNGGTERAKAAAHLAKAVREEWDGILLGLSGTPAPKDPTDWHSLTEIIQPGFLSEGSKGRLLQRLAVLEQMQGATHVYPKIKEWIKAEVELLHKRLQGLTIVVLAKDCMELPELRRELVEMKPTESTMRAARLIAQTSSGGAQALNKLRQLSDGFQYREKGPAARCESPKDDALRNLLERHEEAARVMVFAGYHESVDRATEICIQEGWTVLQADGRGWKAFEPETQCTCAADECICDGKVVPKEIECDKAWYLGQLDRTSDTGEVKKLAYVAHPKSGGLSLNLTACPGAVWYSMDYDFESFAQAMKRGHRGGMDVQRGFTAYILCHLPTDKLILKNLDGKRVLQSVSLGEVVEALG